MRDKKFLAGIVAVVLLSGCATVHVSSDWDTAVQFSNYKTYAWVPGPQPKTGNYRLDDSLLDTRIREAVDRVMAAKGFGKVKEGTPDFWVRYGVSIEGKIDVINDPTPYYTSPYGGAYAPWPTWGGTYVSQYDEGTVVLEFGDAKTKKLIWRGTASTVVEPSKSPEKRKRKIDKGIEKLLRDFPPLPR